MPTKKRSWNRGVSRAAILTGIVSVLNFFLTPVQDTRAAIALLCIFVCATCGGWMACGRSRGGER